MACSRKPHQVAIEELNVLLSFIETENSLLEQEKKDLTIKYHSRPPEERNIMRDILEMHTEFEKDIIKLKEITEDFSKIPQLKNSTTDQTEERLSLISKMQQSIISLQDQVQDLLIKKSSLQSENEALHKQYEELSDRTNLVISDIERLESLEEEDIFNEQYMLLEFEVNKITEILLLLQGKTTLNYAQFPPTEIPYMNERQVADELRRVSIENSMIEEAINSYAQTLAAINEQQEIEVMIDEKRQNIEKIKQRLAEVKEDIAALQTKNSRFSVGLDRNLKFLDNIIDRRNVSPRTSLTNKNKELLNDVMSSINKAKALTSTSKRVS